MLVTTIIALFEGIKNFNKLGYYKILVFVLLFSLIDTLAFSFLHLILKRTTLFILTADILQSIFIFTELLMIIGFYFKTLNTLGIKKSFFFIGVISIISIVTIIIYNFITIKSYSQSILIFEIFLVNFFSGILFVKDINYDLNTIPRSTQLMNRSLFIFINFTAPYYFLSSIINDNNISITLTLNYINDFGYSFLFFQFLKVFKCLR